MEHATTYVTPMMRVFSTAKFLDRVLSWKGSDYIRSAENDLCDEIVVHPDRIEYRCDIVEEESLRCWLISLRVKTVNLLFTLSPVEVPESRYQGQGSVIISYNIDSPAFISISNCRCIFSNCHFITLYLEHHRIWQCFLLQHRHSHFHTRDKDIPLPKNKAQEQSPHKRDSNRYS